MSNEPQINATGELYAALAQARLEFGALTKTKQAKIASSKGSYGYTYADLSDVIEATAEALAKYGVVIIQEPEVITSESGRMMVAVYGCIAHQSGAVRELRPMIMPIAGETAQNVGSAISYARRYQLQAVLNLAADDDDGQGAQNAPQRTQPSQTQKPTNGAQAQHRGPSTPVDVPFGAMQEPSTDETPAHQRMWGQGASTFGPDWDNGARAWLLGEWTGKVTPDNRRTSSSELSDDEKDQFADYIKANVSALQRVWAKQAKAKVAS